MRSLAEEARARARAGPHLTPERLVAYHFRELPDDEAALTQEHLVACRECALQLLDFVAESRRSSQKETEAGWAALRAKLNFVPTAQGSPRVSGPSWRQRLVWMFASPRFAYGVAGLLLTACVSLALWGASLDREKRGLVAELNRQRESPPVQVAPEDEDSQVAQEAAETRRQRDEEHDRVEQLEAQIAKERRRNRELRAADRQTATPPRAVVSAVVGFSLFGARRGGGEEEPYERSVPAGSQQLTFAILLTTPPQLKFPRYAVDVTDVGGLVLSRDNLRKNGSSLIFQSEPLPAGQYRVKVYGISRDTRTEVGERLLKIIYETGQDQRP